MLLIRGLTFSFKILLYDKNGKKINTNKEFTIKVAFKF